jgi:DNA polymerase III delta prime subunit
MTQRKPLKPLLSDVVRPQALSDLTLSTQTIHNLERAMKSGSIRNILFHGPIGSGKTSAARILMEAFGSHKTINRSSETGPDLAKYIKDFAIPGFGRKVCFIDQARLISKRDQAVLPEIIDRLSMCRFIFAATDITKLIPAIQSRLMGIAFEVAPDRREEVQKRKMERYESMLSANG